MAKKPKAAVEEVEKESKKAGKSKKEAPAVEKKAEKEAAPNKKFNPSMLLMEELDNIEKKTGYTSDGFGRNTERLSTGLLAIDMYMDGGIVPGGWYTVSGGEQTCKSTLTMTLLASIVKQKFEGIGAVFDFEGSSDEKYILNIFKTFKLEIDPTEIFGIQDPITGKWIKRGRFRYYPPSNGERFFDYMVHLRKMLPDKQVTLDGDAFLVYENTTKNRSLLAGHYDKNYLSKMNKFRVEASDRGMQAIVVVDSYPAMLPDLLDDEEGSGAMAIQARMFSDGIKRFRGAMRKKMISILGVNQLRKNPMDKYNPDYEPCFIGSTVVHLADGTVDTIRNIVRKKRDVKVLSFDKKTGEVSAKRIIDWKDNGNRLSSDLVKVCYKAFDHNGGAKVAEFVSTKDHKIWTPSGWKSAGSLSAGDAVYLNLPKDTYTTDQQQVIYGALLGDGSFECSSDSIGWNVTYSHVRYQVPYMMWKAQTIDYGDVFDVPNDSSVQRYKPNGELSSFTTFKHYNPDIAEYARILKSNHTKYSKKHVAAVKSILDKIDLRGLAVWYMDDGHFDNDHKNGLWVTTLSCDRFNAELKQHAISVIRTLTGAKATVCPTHGKIVIKGKTECLKFQNALSDFIHPSMSYKIFDCADVGAYVWSNSSPKTSNTLMQTEIVSVGPTDAKSKYTRVYDLTVEDNHTYFVGGSAHNGKQKESRVRRSVRADGIAVSNCGDALKFYCFDPNTLLTTKDGDVPAIELYQKFKETNEQPIVLTKSGFKPVTMFETDGGKFPLPVTIHASGLTFRGSRGHALRSIMIDAVPDADNVIQTIGRPSWRRAKDLKAWNAGQPTLLGDYVFAESSKIDQLKVQIGSELIDHLSDSPSLRELSYWLAMIEQAFPSLVPVFECLVGEGYSAHDMLVNLCDILYEAYNEVESPLVNYIDDFGSQYESLSMCAEYLADVLAEIENDPLAFVPVPVTGVEFDITKPEFYLDVNEPETATVVTSGLLSHNSDVRFRLMSRAIPAPFKGERQVVKEKSVEFENRSDRYRFISGRTIKNKLGGIPNQEFWLRLWEADGKGQARGFDPVYDTYFFLKNSGLMTGQFNKFGFVKPCPLADAKTKLNWEDMRILVNGDKKQITSLCKDIGVKPVSIRKWCFEFIKTDKCRSMVIDQLMEDSGKSTVVDHEED